MAELTNLSRADKLRALAEATARAARKAAPDAREELLEASNTLSSLAHSSELRIKKQEEPVKILPSNATRDELTSSRSRQATRRGAEIAHVAHHRTMQHVRGYWPQWSGD